MMLRNLKRTRSFRSGWLLLLSGALCLLSAAAGLSMNLRTVQSTEQKVASADLTCEHCHAAIALSYRQTAMANGSGPAAAGLLPGSFTDASSGISYRVGLQRGQPAMHFQRSAGDPRGGLEGDQVMEYFIGSGHHGRTYLYQQQGLWFELPINYYTRRAAWDLAPNYDNRVNMPPALPVDPNCLHCHTTGVSASLPRARNSFAGAPFAQGGIGCSACHGDGSAHAASGGSAPILNPAKLDPVRRDSACIQCHLEGDVAVYRAGKSLATFQPGDSLAETAAFFVRASRAAGGARATSQYEALLQSACKQGSGDRLTCTTCHDPHRSPAPAERVAFYRSRCLSCHAAPVFMASSHHPNRPNCAACHMPSRRTTDISHEQVTDHNIQRVPSKRMAAASAQTDETLVPVTGFAAGQRELGLAYAQMAQRGGRTAAARALELLLPLQDGADEQVALNLGFLLQAAGSSVKARIFYERVLELNPTENTALSNLAVLDASEGKLSDAVRLLRTAVKNAPDQSAAALNLALLLCREGKEPEARMIVSSARQFNPDVPALRNFDRRGCAVIGTRP